MAAEVDRTDVASADGGPRPDETAGGPPAEPVVRTSRTVGPLARTLRQALLGLAKFTVGWIVFIALWWAAIEIWDIPKLTLPPPGEVWTVARENWEPLRANTWITLKSVLLAFGISAVLGILVSLALSQSRRVRTVVFPVIVAIQAAPKIALAPLFVVWIGFGPKMAVFIGVLVAVFPMIVNTTAGLATVDHDMVMLAQTMRASQRAIFLRIRLPHALPHIVSGLKTCMVLSIVGVVVGELTGAGAGLGYKISEQSAIFRTDYAFAAVVILVFVSLVLFYAIEILEKQLAWYAKHGERAQTVIGQAR